MAMVHARVQGRVLHTVETHGRVPTHVFTTMQTDLEILGAEGTRLSNTLKGLAVCHTRPRHTPVCLPMWTI